MGGRKILGPNLPEHRPYCTIIPIFFRLPPDQPEFDRDDDPQRDHSWRLLASAKVSGPDLDLEFEVPTFKTDAAAAPADKADPSAKYQLPVDQVRLVGCSRIQVADTYSGVHEFVFPAVRNLGAALGGAGFAIVGTGVIWFRRHARAPFIFPMVFGLFALLLWFCAELWLRSSQVLISPQEATVSHRWLLLRRPTTIPAAKIMSLPIKAGMTSGHRSYYNLKLTRRNGRPKNAGYGRAQQGRSRMAGSRNEGGIGQKITRQPSGNHYLEADAHGRRPETCPFARARAIGLVPGGRAHVDHRRANRPARAGAGPRHRP